MPVFIGVGVKPEATKNRVVESVISAGDIVRGETDIVLANAIYFSGQWPERMFHPWATKPGPFYRVDVPFMSSNRDQFARAMDGFKVLKLPYKQGLEMSTEYSMCIFLPDARDGISAMVDVITAHQGALCDAVRLEAAQVQGVLRVYDCRLDRALPEMGLHLPFSRDATDLRGMLEAADDADPSRPTFLSSKVSKAVVEVNEEGTEATGYTMCLRGGVGDPPPEVFSFVADHPFTFFIVEEWSGVVVFAGHVLDPAAM